MDRETAKNAAQFLQRVQLMASEIPAFMAVSAALADIAAGRIAIAASPPPEADGEPPP